MSSAYNTLVPVTLRVASANFGTIGFGTPLILGFTEAFGSRTKTYGALDEMIDDLGADSAIVHTASLIYADISPPQQVVVGRLNLPYSGHFVSCAPLITNENYTYNLGVKFDGVVYNVSYTVESGDDEEDVVDGLIAALGATDFAGSATKTGTGASAALRLAAVVSGPSDEIVFVRSDDKNALALTENITLPTSDDALGAILSACNDDNPGWYSVVTPVAAKGWVEAVAAWTETQAKVYFADTADTAVRLNTASNVGETIGNQSYNRTALFYAQDTLNKVGARALGDVGNLEPGSYTLNMRQLSGVTPTVLTSAEFTNLAENKVTVHRDLGNRLFALVGGYVGGNLGFIDNTISADWMRFRCQEAYLALMLAADKVPYTTAGFDRISLAFEAVVNRAIAQGILSPGTQGSTEDPVPRVVVPTLEQQTAQDRANRIVRGFKVVGRFAGAVHILPLEIQLST